MGAPGSPETAPGARYGTRPVREPSRTERGRRLTEGYWILLLILFLGLLLDNALISTAALALLLLKVGELQAAFPFIMRHGFNLGLFLMILTILTPVAQDRIGMVRFARELMSTSGLLAVAVSAASAYLAGHGVQYLNEYPQVLVGLLVGSILGVLALGGVPTGPLIPAGVTALLVHLLR